MRKRNLLIILILLLLGGAIWYINRNGLSGVFNTHSGKELSQQYCSSCHIFPEPNLLDKKTWQNSVLPNMGWRLGIKKADDAPYANFEMADRESLMQLNIYPEEPLLKQKDWDKIVKYYIENAPDTPLSQKPHPNIEENLSLFTGKPFYIGKSQSPGVSMVKFDATSKQLYVGDTKKALYIFNPKFTLVSNWFMPSPPVDIDFPTAKAPRIMCIGSMAPTQVRNGNFFSFDPDNKYKATDLQYDSLHRPVSFTTGDLNKDGVEDAIICSFGYYSGSISWYESMDPKKQHILLSQPGARRAVITDFNKDGLPDVIALMAQAREELVLFTNKGNGQFENSQLYTFPSVYGVSDFEIDDFNKDGYMDILVTNGDNWDLSPIKKYYHGVRILTNNKNKGFEETYFYPSYGATRARAADFDLDGDLDIALISFSDDLAKTDYGFLFLENDGKLNFVPNATSAAANGKWITMEVADIDSDGDEDIVLGSFIYNIGEMSKMVSRSVQNFPDILYLENKKK